MYACRRAKNRTGPQVHRSNPLEASFLYTLLILLVGFGLGCDDRQPIGDVGGNANGGLRMLPVFDLTLRESDTLFIADLVDLQVFPGDGSLFVADRFAGRVVRFDRTGRPTQVYGRKGSGPGELVRPGLPSRIWTASSWSVSAETVIFGSPTDRGRESTHSSFRERPDGECPQILSMC